MFVSTPVPREGRTWRHVMLAAVRITQRFGVASAAGQPSCWVECRGQRFPLTAGENVIGRDHDVEVRIDQSTVSRRHARLVVTGEGTLLEDVASKNGTFLGTERVSAPKRLADGDAIHIGSLLVTFHSRAAVESTETQGFDSAS